MHTEMRDANKVVDTANLDPLGMLFTWLTSSSPSPCPTILSRREATGISNPSMPGGMIPEAITAALSNPR